jgi:hypothetical protein
MLTFFSCMLCTSKTHPFSLGNYLGTSPIIGNLMRSTATSVEWTWLGLELPSLMPSMLSCTHGDIVSPISCALSCILVSNFVNVDLH